jgi:hypothetical protein
VMLSPQLQQLFNVLVCVVSARMSLSTPQCNNFSYLFVLLSVLERDSSQGFKCNYSTVIEAFYVSYNFFLRGTVLLNLLQKQKDEGGTLSTQEEQRLISLGTRSSSEGLTVLSTLAMCNHATKRDGESRLPKLQDSKYTEEEGVLVTYQGQIISQAELNGSVHYLIKCILDQYYEILPKEFLLQIPGG